MKYKQTQDGLIDPKSLTPKKLYRLQSETWDQGFDRGVNKAIESLEEFDGSAHEGFDIHEVIEYLRKRFK